MKEMLLPLSIILLSGVVAFSINPNAPWNWMIGGIGMLLAVIIVERREA